MGVYAIRQAISKSLVAYYQKYVDEASKKEIKDILISYDRSLLVADPRRNEPKVRRSRRQSQIPEILPLKKGKKTATPMSSCGSSSSSSAAVAPRRWPEVKRGKRQTGRIYIFIFFLCPLQIYSWS